MMILKVLLYLQVVVACCAFPDLYNEIEIEEANATLDDLDDNGTTRGRSRRQENLPPPEYAVIEIPVVLIPYLPMYNDTHSNVSQQDYILINRGPKHLPIHVVLPISAIYIIIFITGVVGNTLVSIVTIKYTNMHSATNFYLFSLAVSDLILLLLGLPNDLSVYWQQYPWIYGEAVCRLRAFASEMSSYCSVLTIVAFSVERYLAVCKPLESYQISTLARASKIIALIWIVSFIFALPFAFYTDVNYIDFPPDSGRIIEETAFCAMFLSNIPNLPIYETSTILFFVIPLIVLSYLYWQILKKLRERYAVNGQGLGVGRDQLARRQRSRRSIIRMLGAVVICFFLCWAPFHLQRLFYIHMTSYRHYQVINEWLYYITGCFYYFSSTVNPILYSLMSTRYREAFKDTLCCRAPRRRRRPALREKRSSDRSCTMRPDVTEEAQGDEVINNIDAAVPGTESGTSTVVQVTDQNGNTKTRLVSSESNGLIRRLIQPGEACNYVTVECEAEPIKLDDVKNAMKETYI